MIGIYDGFIQGMLKGQAAFGADILITWVLWLVLVILKIIKDVNGTTVELSKRFCYDNRNEPYKKKRNAGAYAVFLFWGIAEAVMTGWFFR